MPLELSRGVGPGGTFAGRGRGPASALPNVTRGAWLSDPTDDPSARRRELRVVLALCEARSRGARERDAPQRTLTLMRDG